MMQEMNYIRFGDYYIPDIRLPEENRPIGRWGRMHRDYIKEHNPIRFNDLCLSGELWTYLADLNEQAQSRLELIIGQMPSSIITLIWSRRIRTTVSELPVPMFMENPNLTISSPCPALILLSLQHPNCFPPALTAK